jgi:Tfp pilus assembly protein PilX
MKSKYLSDQRGVAMVIELVLVAVVLGLAGVAVYQSAHHNKTASTTTAPKADNSAAGLASQAADSAVQDSATDASVAATAETSTDELSATDSDVANLGSSSNGF